jgi:hypothetical protein
MSMNAIEHLRHYTAIQKKLVTVFLAQYPLSEDPFLSTVPKGGALAIDDEFWEFQKHGVGIAFTEATSKQIIDVHIGIRDFPQGIDGSRIAEYFQSLGIEKVNHFGILYDVTSERKIKKLVTRLILDGLLFPHSSSGLYFLKSLE